MAGSQRALLVVFVDALGPSQWNQLSSGRLGLGAAVPLRGELGYSSGALATVLTGAAPTEHGRMCLFSVRDEQDAGLLAPLRWLGLLPRVVHERAVFRRRIAQLFARWNHLSGYFALHKIPPEMFGFLDAPEREDLFTARAVGEASTFLSDARDAGLAVYASPWQLPEEPRWAHAHAALATRPTDLAFLYVAGLDGLLHAEGAESARSRAFFRRTEDHIARARDAMARGGRDPSLILVGDHGMAAISRHVNPTSLLEALRPTPTLRTFCDSTMLRFWGSPAALETARTRCLQHGLPGAWLDSAALASLDVSRRIHNYGDAMFVLTEGSLFVPSHLGGAVRGMHGYLPGSASSEAALVSSLPGASNTRSLRDVAGLIRTSLGLPS